MLITRPYGYSHVYSVMRIVAILVIAIIARTVIVSLGISTILIMLANFRTTTEPSIVDSTYSPLFILHDESKLSEYLLLV